MRLPIWLGAVVLALSQAASAASLLIDKSDTVGGFFVLRASDCSTVYYVPVNYRIDNGLSSILAEKVDGKRLIDINIYLAPIATEPDGAQAELMRKWGRDTRPACANDAISVKAYPSVFQDSAVGYVRELEFPDVTPIGQSGGAQLLHFTLDPSIVSLSSALYTLNNLQMLKTVNKMSLVHDVEVTIDADYDVAADFYTKTYIEKTCVITHSRDILGRTSGSEDCSYTPREMQLLGSARAAHGYIMTTVLGDGIAIQVAQKLQNQAMSRLALSLFAHDQVFDTVDVTRVVLGKLNRELSGHYHDYLSLDRIQNGPPVQALLNFPELGEFAKPQLTRIYSNQGM